MIISITRVFDQKNTIFCFIDTSCVIRMWKAVVHIGLKNFGLDLEKFSFFFAVDPKF